MSGLATPLIARQRVTFITTYSVIKGLKTCDAGVGVAVGDGAPILVLDERLKGILEAISTGVKSLDEVASQLGQRREDLMRFVEELRVRGLLSVEKRSVERIELTEEGRRYAQSLMPEEKLGLILERCGGAQLGELSSLAERLGLSLTDEEVRIGLQHLARFGAVRVRDSTVILEDAEALKRAVGEARGLREALVRVSAGAPVAPELLEQLKRRRLVSVRRVSELYLALTEEARRLLDSGALRAARVVTALTPEVIISGEWRSAVFKEYDLSLPPPRVYPGRKHPYLEFLDEVRETLVAMGFEEMKGPHVELELWNFDALFQAQDHPAREIHDTFFVKYPTHGFVRDAGLLERVKAVHEHGGGTGSKGWGYRWDPLRAARLILRTQTTAVSVRTLYSRSEGEYRCFALDRVFRPENLDAKHSMEFYQLEGIIVSKRVTLRHLIGFFEELARRLGLGPVKIKPAYFPFTEPSVEGFIKHPKLGWIEVFPGGMFRPEVLEPLGVKGSNVAAWGIGIDRIAMTVLGVDDIRLLFAQDLEFLRNWEPPIRW